MSGALILTGLPAVADEAPTPEPTTPITVQNTVPDADAAVPDETPVADVAPEDEASVPAPEDADGDVADGLAGRDGGEGSAPSESDESSQLDMAVVSPLAVAPYAGIVCEASYVYSLSGAGVLRQVISGGSTSDIKVLGTGSFYNALGIGENGTVAYAVLRDNGSQNSSVTIYKYDAVSGAVTAPLVYSLGSGRTTGIIAGAVDLSTGNYLFGGYARTSDGIVFRLWAYNPTSNSVTFKGAYNTGQTAVRNQSAGNGDMAFDAAGNLYVLWHRTNSISITTVTSAALAAANGTQIPVQPPTTLQIAGDDLSVNGIAFDTDGTAYLGLGGDIRRYDPTNWTYLGPTTTITGGSSTDLSSCASPATLTVKKNVVSRVNQSDQFKLEVRSGTTVSATATTSGAGNGIQSEQVGPIPVVSGNTYTVSETFVSGAAASNYASTWVCTSNDNIITQGVGTTGQVVIPTGSGTRGAAVECVFTNSPLTATVTITKRVQDSQGQNEQVAAGWTVDAAVTATSGTVTRTPNETRETSASGQAVWGLQFGEASGQATVNVSETQRTGYQFVSGQCVVTPLTGNPRTVTITGETATPVTGVAPGDKVACTYVNKVRPATVTIGKQLQDFTGANAQPAGGWTVGATLVSPASGVTITTPATAQTQTGTGQVSTPWAVNYPVPAAGQPLASATVNVQETMQTGYAFVSGTCTITSASGASRSQELASATAQLTGLAPGDAAVCTFTNKPIPGTVTWEKVDAAGNHLGGSEWTLSGLDLSSTTVVDCTSATCDPGPYRDQDPAPGVFRIVGLAWGDYTLVESSAPAGFVRDDTPHNFTISAGARDYVFASAFVNIPREGPPLPLTGGQSATMYTLLGGGLLGLASVWAVLRRRRNIRGAA
ncbi:LPXTG cell wall anchor domain-containing protein [Microbacterium lacticum]|uniref:prealbumin-like fold domain-containing protein n=1 Tax=Microbacterium lacticum TaxID=33885 RepID=UPI0018B086B7|nr:prealbumin-like fold domain-containing protein [Microbacterium lacticum]MBF9335724.1 LPXTG cell wall anchor domain-containing protein [Microbacterium lacticum]